MILSDKVQAALDAGYTPEEIKDGLIKIRDENLKSNEPSWRQALRSFGQGATFGFEDELAGVLAGLISVSKGGEFTPAYESMSQSERMKQKDFARANPKTDLSIQMATGITPGVGVFKAGKAISPFLFGGPVRSGLTAGTVSGGIAGSGYSNPGERLSGSAIGATVGGALGATIPAATSLVGAAVSKATSSPKKRALEIIMDKMEEESMTTADLRESLKDMGHLSTITDTGDSFRSVANAVVRVPGPIKTKARLLANTRQEGQHTRLDDLFKSTISPDDYLTQLSLIEERATKLSAPYYKEAFSAMVPVTENLARLSKRPNFKKALNAAVTKARDEGDDITIDTLETGQQIPLKVIDYVKRAFDDRIDVAIRRGDKGRDALRILTETKNKMIKEVSDESIPAFKNYAIARSIYGGEVRNKQALDAGYQYISSRKQIDWEAAIGAFENMADSEKDMFRVGAAQALRDKVMMANINRDMTKGIFGPPAMKEKLKVLFKNDEDMNKFIKGVETEGIFADTKNYLFAGSNTAQNLADIGGSRGIGIGTDIARGYTGAALMNTFDMIAQKINMPQRVRNELGKIILTQDRGKINEALNKIDKIKETGKRSKELKKTLSALVFSVMGMQSGRLQEDTNGN